MDATECAVRTVRSVGPDAIAIDVETPVEFDALPGQFVKVTFDVVDTHEFGSIGEVVDTGEFDESELPDSVDQLDELLVSRFYTISSPNVEDTFEITVGVDPDGTVGPFLAELTAGDTVTITGPFGKDYYEGEDPSIVIAGGPGVGPAVGIAECAVNDDTDIAVIYWDDDPIYESRIHDLSSDGATVAIVDSDAEFSSAIDDVLDQYDSDSQLFVYGFADFIDTATTAIEAGGGDAGNAKIENFG